EIDLMCPGFPNREAEVQRLSLALAVTAITLCCGTVTRAQVSTAFYPVGPTVCQPLPSWYPRGWELMVRSLRHLCLWTFILSSNLLLLSGGLLVPASVNSCRTPGPSQAISASWLVVVKMQSGLRRRRFRRACDAG